LKLTGPSSHVVLIDSDLCLEGSSESIAAIRNDSSPLGAVFARNVNLRGFTQSYRSSSLSVGSTGRIDEFVSKFSDRDEPDVPAIAQSSPSTRSLNLPIRDVPLRPRILPKEWIRVEAYRSGASGDGETVARAFAVAATTPAAKLLFERAAYRLDTPISVPASVQLIYLSGADISVASNLVGSGEEKTAFVVSEASDKALHIVEGSGEGSKLIRYGAARDLVIDSVSNPYTASKSSLVAGAPTLGDVFLVSVNSYGRGSLAEFDMKAAQKGQRIFARGINTEFKGEYNFRVNTGGTLWVFGYKVEGASRNFRIEAGGTLEVLGGVMNEPFKTDLTDPELASGVDNAGGDVSLVFNTSTHIGTNPVGHDVVIRDENLPPDRRELRRGYFPARPDADTDKQRPMLIVPLYRSASAGQAGGLSTSDSRR
jgi:hypothetical protein